MIVLGLDTTTPAGSVAVRRDGSIAGVAATDPGRPFSDQLPGAIEDLLRSLDLTVADVDLFGVASGPGSLTGMRVGIATIQGLALALGRPAVGISALEALAYTLMAARCGRVAGDCLGAWTDAHRGEVFAALYVVDAPGHDAGSLRVIDGPAVGVPIETAERWAAAARGRRVRVTGNAATANASLLRDRLGPATDIEAIALLAGPVAELAEWRASRGEAGPPHALQPLYVRRPDAEVARDRARTQGQAERGPR